jgi:hypothetical protein
MRFCTLLTAFDNHGVWEDDTLDRSAAFDDSLYASGDFAFAKPAGRSLSWQFETPAA